jgi:protein SCO1/2
MRLLYVVLAVTLVCLVAAVGVLVAAHPGATGRTTATTTSGGLLGPIAPTSMPAIDFALRDQSGKLIRLGAYSGRVVLLAFVYSTCTNSCPVIAETLRGTLGELARRVPTIAISVDPEQDTPAHVRAFLARWGLSGDVDYLAGPRRALAPIWRLFGIQPQSAENARSGNFTVDVELLDKTGKPRVGYAGLNALDPDAIAHDIRTLEAEPAPAHPARRVEF